MKVSSQKIDKWAVSGSSATKRWKLSPHELPEDDLSKNSNSTRCRRDRADCINTPNPEWVDYAFQVHLFSQ
jgi:hypothetical protein